MKPVAYQTYEKYERTYWWYVGRRTIILDWVFRMVQPPAHILDYGCGSGLISRGIQDHGYLIDAADNSPIALEMCLKNGVKKIINTAEQDLPQNQYELILLLDVLEHIENDSGFLKTICSSLKPNGFILMTVPAFSWLWSGEDYVSHHVRRYTLDTLRTAAIRSGIQIQHLTFFNMLLFIPVAATIFWKNIFDTRSRTATMISDIPRLLNSFCTALFSFEKILLRYVGLPIGTSLLLIGRQAETGRGCL
jgi:2-polyprenyl-3-methyl-5-hydroxy-6-metoxy-1,4-benzoquinol methylase